MIEASGNRFVGGFPNLFHTDTLHPDVMCGILLLNHSAATFEWFETSLQFNEQTTGAQPAPWSETFARK